MITLARTAVAAPGKIYELMAFAKEIQAVIKRISGMHFDLATTVGSTVGEVAWIGKYESMAHLEEVAGKLNSNAEYQALIAKAGPLTQGAMVDRIWRHFG